MNRPAIMVLTAFAIVITVHARGQSQDLAKVNEPVDRKDPLLEFSIKNPSDISLVRRAREKAIRQCKEILQASGKREDGAAAGRLNDYTGTAIYVLGELRAKDSECIDALCAHLTREPEVVMVSEDALLPLTMYPAAKALVQIGGRDAAEGILRRMKKKLDRKELLICAHVLKQVDEQPVTLERMRVAATKRSPGEDPLEVTRDFRNNLSKVKQWLEDPAFATDEKFRP